jgi:DNA-binding ferritin-like protein
MESRMLKRPTEPVKKLTRPVLPEKEIKAEPVNTSNTTSSLDSMMSNCISELMNARNSFHKLHLGVTGTGSYAAHKALNELYDALPDFADTLIEGYQGITEKLMVFKHINPRTVEDVSDAVSYLRELYAIINKLQAMMPYSEIVNNLDLVKDAINSTKYKLLFLK